MEHPDYEKRIQQQIKQSHHVENMPQPAATSAKASAPAVAAGAARSTNPGKILFVSHEATRTGAPIFLLHLMRWLRAHTNTEFSVLLRQGGGVLEPEFRALCETYTPETFGRDGRNLAGVSLIYSNTGTNGALLDSLPRAEIPIVTHIHELEYVLSSFGAGNFEAVKRQTTHFIACSEAVAENLKETHGIQPGQISVHFETIAAKHTLEQAGKTAPDAIRSRFKVPADALLIAACGTVEWRKSPDLFLQLAATLRAEAAMSRPVHFVWIGSIPAGERSASLYHDLKQLGLEDCVQFIGEQENPAPILAAADLFCLPSREDPFPLAMLEAAALGKPIVCFQKSGGAPEFCKLGGGVAVPYLDVNAMARECLRFIADSTLTRSVGEIAARLVRENFDVGATLPELWKAVERFKAAPNSGHAPKVDQPLSELDQAIQRYQCQMKAEPNNPAVKESLAGCYEAKGFAVMARLLREEIQGATGSQSAASSSPSVPVTKANVNPSETAAADQLFASIIIPVFNRLDMTQPCIEAIHRVTRPGSFEVIVVDNASTDGTAEYLQAEQAAGRLRVIHNDQNLGFSKACNQGIRAARGAFILLLNNDTVPLSGWLDALFDEMLTHTNVGAVGSCLLYPGGELLQHAGVMVGAGGGNAHPYHPWRLQRLDRVPQARESRDCQAITAACLFIRRPVLDRVGLLDEEFINGFEDVDLCFRIGQAGYRLRYCARSVVIHHESMTPGRGKYEQANYNRLNERWKSIIKPDETAESTFANVMEINCRERLVLEPDNPRALAALTQICRDRNDPDQAAEFQGKLAKATQNGKSIPLSVSIVIPVFNNLKLTKQCLAALAKTTGFTTAEVIVVDNASTDGSTEFLRQAHRKGQLRLIYNNANFGFAHACNQGAAEARGKFVLFLNNDTVPLPGWLDAMVTTAFRDAVGVVGAKLLYPNRTIQHAGIGWIKGIPDHPGRGSQPHAPEVNVFRELDMVTGACFLMPRDLFLQLHGFDEAYRNGVEDIDLCLRVRAAGRKVVYDPRAVVYHLEGRSAGRFNHVNENLKLFFSRWGKSFDSDFKFKAPQPVKVIAASQSILAKGVQPASIPHSVVTNPRSLTVSWEGSFLDFGSLSHVNRALTHSVESTPGIQLHRVSTGEASSSALNDYSSKLATSVAHPQVTVRHAWPPNWSRPKSGKLVVIQPWEFGSLPVDWVKQAANVDEFWVPSRIVQEFYTSSGIEAAKVHVVPNGIDPELFRPCIAPRALATKNKFRFLFVGGTIGRKGPDVLLNAYLKSFTAADDVCLVIKDFGGESVYKGQTFAEQIKLAQQRPNAPEILYLDSELAPGELPGLYTACNCLVHPYRGEGFGLPVLEAMSCGLPVIVTGGGATDDFATDEVAYRLPSTRRNIGHEVGGMKLVSEAWLLEPDTAALAERMKWIVANPEAARATGLRASEHARRNWTWQHAAQIAANRLIELGAEPAAKPAVAPQTAKPVATVLPPCAKLGDLSKARESFGRKNHSEAWAGTISAIQTRPFHPEAFLLLAEIALAAGDSTIARQCAQRARDLAPGWKAPKQFLQKPLKGNTRPDWLQFPEAISNLKSEISNRLTVCVITKNEEKFIAQCLQSIRSVASQIVVVDTGSTDRTVEIAKAHGAEVHSFAWCDDFSAARNAALEHATGDWILMLDADEELPADQHERLQSDIRKADAIAHRLPLVNKGQEDGRSFVPRLFRNAPGVYFYGRIHEQVFPSLIPYCKTWGLQTGLGTAQLLHHGYSKELVKDRSKIERNLRLLKQAVVERPDDANLVMNFGLELVRSGEQAKGIEKYREAFRMMSAQAPGEIVPELREVLLTQFTSHLYKVRAHEEVLAVLNSPLARSSSLAASLHFAAGLAHFELKQYRDAAEQMRQCLAKRSQPALSPINTDILTSAPNHCLALSLAQVGDTAGAEKSFLAALAEKGRTENVKLDYAKFLAQQNPVDALHKLHEIVAENAACAAAWKLGSEIALARPEFLEFACDWTSEAIKNLPEDAAIIAQRAEALLLSEQTANAKPLWERTCNCVRPPNALAALILCAAVESQPIPPTRNPAEETATSKAFVAWYQRLLTAGANQTIIRLNSRVEALKESLPTAAGLLNSAISAAKQD